MKLESKLYVSSAIFQERPHDFGALALERVTIRRVVSRLFIAKLVVELSGGVSGRNSTISLTVGFEKIHGRNWRLL